MNSTIANNKPIILTAILSLLVGLTLAGVTQYIIYAQTSIGREEVKGEFEKHEHGDDLKFQVLENESSFLRERQDRVLQRLAEIGIELREIKRRVSTLENRR